MRALRLTLGRMNIARGKGKQANGKVTEMTTHGMNIATIALASAGLLLASTGQAAPAAEAPSGGLTFLVASDHFEDVPPGFVPAMVDLKPAFVVGVGDLVMRSQERDFRVFEKVVLAPLKGVGADYFPVLGNHDFPNENWKKLWGNEKGRPYYSFDRGDCHFVILDLNKAMAPDGKTFAPGSEQEAIQKFGENFKAGSAQHSWLQRDLAQTNKRHIFVFAHIPAFTFGDKTPAVEIQREISPLCEKHKVSVFFTAHDHSYQRFVPLRVDLSGGKPRPVPDDENGVVYVVSAVGDKRGNIYKVKRNPLHAACASVSNFLRVEVKGDTAEIAAIEVPSRREIDRFVVRSRR